MPTVNVGFSFNATNPSSSTISFVPNAPIEIPAATGRVTYKLATNGIAKFAPNPIQFVTEMGKERNQPEGVTSVDRKDDYKTELVLKAPPAPAKATFRFRVRLQKGDATFLSSDPTIVIMRPDGT